MLLLDREIRRGGLPGFNSYLLLTLDSRPDAAALVARLAAGDEFARWLRAPLLRTFPWRRAVRDASRQGAAPRVDVLDAPPAGEEEPWTSLLNARLAPERGENLRFTIFPAGDGTWRVGVLFSHLLVDAKAAERMVAGLSANSVSAAWPDGRSLIGGASLGDVAKTARNQANAIAADATGPLHMVGHRNGHVGPCRGASLPLDAAATAAAVAVGREAAGYAMEGLWYLACALAAVRDVEEGPPRPGARFSVPLPTSLDRKGEARALGNNLVFLFLAADVEEARDPRALAKRFRERMLRHLKERSDRASQAQMEFCRMLPLFVQGALARHAVGGGLASLFFTNPGPVAPELTSFFGARVTDAAHFPIPSPEPGLCAAAWSFDGKLRLGVTWVDGCVEDDRARRLLARWKAHVTGTT